MIVSLALFVAFLAQAAAQGFDGLPKCAQDCALSRIPKECGVKVSCICAASSFIDAITCCVAGACEKDDQEKTIEFAKGICNPAGVNNIPDSVECSTAAGSGTVAAATGTNASSASTGTLVTASNNESATPTSTAGTASVETEVSVTTSASAAGSTSSVAAANNLMVQGAGVMGAAFLGAVALI